MKIITKEKLQKLLDNGILRNTHRGYVNKKNNQVAFYKSRNHLYTEDYYADMEIKQYKNTKKA